MQSLIPPLYRYSISKLPLDTFIDLTSSVSDAQQLKYAIVHQLKTTAGSSSAIRGGSACSATIHSDNHESTLKRRRILLEDASNRNTAEQHPTDFDKSDRTRTTNTAALGITTVAMLLQLSPYAIFHRLDPILTLSECIRLYQRVCIHCAPTVKTAYSLLSMPHDGASTVTSRKCLRPDSIRYNYVSTGWHTLNNKLHGGLRIGTITELMGCAGTGKTQLALQATIATALDQNMVASDGGTSSGSSGGGTIWIDTEQKVSLVRLQEMTIERCGPDHPSQVHTVLENVTIHSPSNINELVQLLDSLESEIVNRNELAGRSSRSSSHTTKMSLPVRLIVVDSIAAPARREYNWSAAQQAICMMQIAQLLKRYADLYSIAILIVNQITTSSTSIRTGGTNRTNPMNDITTHHQQRAALGTAWHHCVTTRIELQQGQEFDHDNNHTSNATSTTTTSANTVSRRQIKIVKSLTVEPSYVPIPFQITVQGIVDTPKN